MHLKISPVSRVEKGNNHQHDGSYTTMEQFLSTETLIIELLLIVSIVAMAVRRLRIPYTVALVVAGLVDHLPITNKIRSSLPS